MKISDFVQSHMACFLYTKITRKMGKEFMKMGKNYSKRRVILAYLLPAVAAVMVCLLCIVFGVLLCLNGVTDSQMGRAFLALAAFSIAILTILSENRPIVRKEKGAAKRKQTK